MVRKPGCRGQEGRRQQTGVYPLAHRVVEAGADRRAPHGVGLRYRSWTDRKSELAGFSGSYGEKGVTARIGSPVAIIVWNFQAAAAKGGIRYGAAI